MVFLVHLFVFQKPQRGEQIGRSNKISLSEAADRGGLGPLKLGRCVLASIEKEDNMYKPCVGGMKASAINSKD